MARADLNVIIFRQTLTPSNPTATRSFPIEGTPIDDAFLLLQIRSVGSSSHRIEINDTALPGMDLPPAPGGSRAWQFRMDHIPPGVLRSGTNHLSIHRADASDNFEIANVVVNWRE